MAAPLVVSTASNRTTGTATSHTGAATGGGSGDYLILITATVGNFAGGESATGFTLLENPGSPSSTGLTIRAYWKVAAGTSSETINVSTDDPCYFACICYRVSGVTAILSDSDVDTGGDMQPPPLTIADLSVDHRFIVATSWDGSDSVAGYPYTDYQVYEAAGGTVGVASCSDVVGGSPVTPGPFPETTSSPPWLAVTIGLAGSAPTHDTPLGPTTSDGSGTAYPLRDTPLGPTGSNGDGTFTPAGGALAPTYSEGYGSFSPIPGATTTLGPVVSDGTGAGSAPYTILGPASSLGSGSFTEICSIVKAWDPGTSSWRAVPSLAYVSGSYQVVSKVKFNRGGSWIGCS